MYARAGEENQEKEIPKEMNMVEIKKVRPQLLTRLLIIMVCALLAASCRSRKALTQGGTPGLSSEEMLEKAEKLGKKILLPIDAVTIKDFPNPIDAPVETETCDITAMPADREGCDIGPKSAELFAEAVKTALPLIVFE